MINFLIWSFSIFNIFGTILNVKRSYWSFVIWTLCNIFWLLYDIFSHQYARVLSDIINLTTSTWGIFEGKLPLSHVFDTFIKSEVIHSTCSNCHFQREHKLQLLGYDQENKQVECRCDVKINLSFISRFVSIN